MCTIIVLIILAYVFYRVYEHFFPTPSINPNGKYVLISGCDSGFGNRLAIELDASGFNVLAGVYDLNNIDTLQKKLSSKATVFKLDITRIEDIDSVFDIVSKKTNNLHALVNNAGIGTFGNIDWITVDSMRSVMNVNFFGHVAMTKKFLPLLIAKRNSRVVNICSVAGFLTKPGMSSYAASKYALESFSDCLRREMAVWGLHVSIIEPGFMRTGIIQGHDQSLRKLWNGLPDDVKQRWGEEFFEKIAQDVQTDVFVRSAEDPNKVVRALKHAVMNTKPQIRYRPGWQSSLVMFPMSTGPAWLTDYIMTLRILKGVLPADVQNQAKD